jgi:hypothetical protein
MAGDRRGPRVSLRARLKTKKEPPLVRKLSQISRLIMLSPTAKVCIISKGTHRIQPERLRRQAEEHFRATYLAVATSWRDFRHRRPDVRLERRT